MGICIALRKPDGFEHRTKHKLRAKMPPRSNGDHFYGIVDCEIEESKGAVKLCLYVKPFDGKRIPGTLSSQRTCITQLSDLLSRGSTAITLELQISGELRLGPPGVSAYPHVT